MKLTDAINRVDKLYPNPYTFEEKLQWCLDLSTIIRQTIRKVYNQVTFRVDGTSPFLIPPEVNFDSIEAMYIDGKRYDKTDLRTLLATGHNVTGEVKIVYMAPVENIRTYDIWLVAYEAVPRYSEGVLISYEIWWYNETPIQAGDTVYYAFHFVPPEPAPYTNKTCHILEKTSSCITISPIPEYERQFIYMGLKRVITETTEMDAPFDLLYVYYLLMQISYFQQDYEAYNAHLRNYEVLLEGYAMWYKERNPLDKSIRFKNFWNR